MKCAARPKFKRFKPPAELASRCANAIFARDRSSGTEKKFQYVPSGPSSSSSSKPSPASSSSTSTPQRISSGFNFQEKEGDLFSCPPSWSLAHCVSVDLRMGKGIAVHFKRKFQGVDDLLRQGPKVGGCVMLKKEERFVYYLTTKQKFSDRPTYETLRSSLETMKSHCVEHNVTNLAMPAIGCGLDGLYWPRVKDMIKDIFQELNMSITIYLLGKSDKSRTKSAPKRQRTV